MRVQALQRAAAAARAPAPAEAAAVESAAAPVYEAAGAPAYEVYVGAQGAPSSAPVVTVSNTGSVRQVTPDSIMHQITHAASFDAVAIRQAHAGVRADAMWNCQTCSRAVLIDLQAGS